MEYKGWILNEDTISFFKTLSNEYKSTSKSVLTSLKHELNKEKETLKRDIEIYNEIIAMLNSNGIREENGILIYNNIKIYKYNNIIDISDKYEDELEILKIEIDDLTNMIDTNRKGIKLKRKQYKDRVNRLTNELSILERKKDEINSTIILKKQFSTLSDKQKSLIKNFFEYKEKLRRISNLETRINEINKVEIDRRILITTVNNLLEKEIIKKEDIDYIDNFIAHNYGYQPVDSKIENSNIINAYIKQLKNKTKRKKELKSN